MTLKGNVDSGTWSVEAVTAPAPDGGFLCHINVMHGSSAERFTRTFPHHRVFDSEKDAVLEGLREGMVWIELKLNRAFEV